MDPRDFLRALMDEQQLNPSSLSTKTRGRTKQPQIFRFLNGTAKEPKRSTMEPLAEYFGVLVDAFFDARVAEAEWLRRKAQPNQSDAQSKTPNDANTSPVSDVYRLVPVISSVQAGAWRDVHDPYPPGVSDVWIPCPSKHGPNTFALRVEGDSMDAPGGYREGEIVFVDPAVHAVPGKDVVVRTPDGRATLKRLKADAEGPYLMALNPHWPTRILRMPEGTVICGVVIGSYIER